uniref:Ribosomal protein S11 n=1 Tax=Prasinococcus sp. CCMP1194 TaxID=110672 RepID=A0A650AKK6_9VIRI|nr:ribosomal protein S11 [Prasinococcus sp. CCMP1194]
MKSGVLYISMQLNNTFYSIQSVGSLSAGCAGFKGAERSTPYAVQLTAEKVGKLCLQKGYRSLSVVFLGNHSHRNRQAALRGLGASGIEITDLYSKIRVSYNGCRPKKKRRI